jgi:hypothetical protein
MQGLHLCENSDHSARPPYHRGVRRLEAIVVVLLLVALVAGCGTKYTKSDFVARADGICTNAVRDIRSLPAPSGDIRALSRYFGKLLPIVQSEASQIRALKRPSGDQAPLDRYLSVQAEVVTEYRRLAAAAKRGDAQGVVDAEAKLQASPVATLAAQYGLHDCGTPGGTGV